MRKSLFLKVNRSTIPVCSQPVQGGTAGLKGSVCIHFLRIPIIIAPKVADFKDDKHGAFEC